MTLYQALEERAAGLARETDASPALARLVRTTAIGAARWSEKTRQDVQAAHVQGLGDGPTFVVRISARESVVPTFRSVISTTFSTAALFVRTNPDAIAVLEALSRWAKAQITRGAVRFETRWAPGAEGFLAITAVHAA